MEANRSIRHRESIVTSELDVEVTAEANPNHRRESLDVSIDPFQQLSPLVFKSIS